MVFKDFPAKTMGAQGNDAGIEIVLISCGKLFLQQVFVNPQNTGGDGKGPTGQGCKKVAIFLTPETTP